MVLIIGDPINAPRVLNCTTGVKFSKIIYTTGSTTGTIYYSDCTVTSTSVTTPTIYNESTLGFDFYDDANNKFYSIFDTSLGYPSSTLDSSYETARDAAVWNSSSSGTKKSGGLRTKLNPMGGFKKSSSPSSLKWNSTPIYAPSSLVTSFNYSNHYIIPIPIGIYYKYVESYFGTPIFGSYNINNNTTNGISSFWAVQPSGCYSLSANKGIVYSGYKSGGTNLEPTVTFTLKETTDFSTYTTTNLNSSMGFSKMVPYYKGIVGIKSSNSTWTTSTILNSNLSTVVSSDTTIPNSESFYDISYAGQISSLLDCILICTSGGIYSVVVDKWGGFNSFNKPSNTALYSLYRTNTDGWSLSNFIACGPSGSFCEVKNISSSSLTLQYHTVDNSEDFNACCYGNGMYLVGSNSGKLYLSTDLTNWELNYTFDGQICSIAYSCNKFFVMIEKNQKISIYVSK